MKLTEKKAVHDFWNKESCGEVLYLKELNKNGYEEQSSKDTNLNHILKNFAKFSQSQNKKVLEIGVGLGADHQNFSEAGADLYGIDLTERAIQFTQNRLQLFNLKITTKKPL